MDNQRQEQRDPEIESAGGTVVTLNIPADLDATDLSSLRPLFDALQSREVASPEEAEQWLLDRSELEATVAEARADLYIATTCRTEDEAVQSAWQRYLENVMPELRKLGFELDRAQADLFERFSLPVQRYEVLKRNTLADVQLFREENIPLTTAVTMLDNRYDRLCGAMMIDFDGEERTIQQMSKFLQSDDRSVRERAWRAIADRRLQDRDAINDIFDEMIAKRTQMARNAGFETYISYNFKSRHRFDYGTAESLAFHDAIEQVIVPFRKGLEERRRDRLGLERLRPWDLAVDELGRPPLRPFSTGQQLVEQSRLVFDRLDSDLGELYRELGDDMGGNFDLDSRKGKAPGGYQYMRDRSRRPFIFMNAAGLHRDIETMVHEAGHAFHSMLARHEPLVAYRRSPIEFAEVASMSMELLSMPHWDAYYDNREDADRARREQLEGSLSLLPWVATVDAFQHWLYANPEHSRDQRRDAWLGLDDRFGGTADWSGLDDARAHAWHRQGHLFGHPFYYIEYGIAQLGALGLWLISLEEGPERALELYKQGLTIGGARPLPELFEAAGVPFDFTVDHIARLREAVERELAKLPE